MIFQRSLLRELTSVATAVFSVLLAIMLTTQVVRLFDKAASGKMATDAIFAMIAFTALGSFGTLLSITVFISVLVVLTRMYRDNEMAIWLSAGVSPMRWIPPVLSFAAPLAVVIALVSLLIAPWAYRKGNEYADLLKQREDVTALSPGIFKETRRGERVYFVEHFSSSTGSAQNIFVQSQENQTLSTILARRGNVETTDNGERYLVLEEGRRYDGSPGQADYQVIEFERYKVKINQVFTPVTNLASKMLPTKQLLDNPTPNHRAELAGRISMPIASLILALLAIPLAYYNPRSGHTFNLLIALFIYQFYYQSIHLIQSLIGREQFGGFWLIIPLHILMLLVFFALMMVRRTPIKMQWHAWQQKRLMKP